MLASSVACFSLLVVVFIQINKKERKLGIFLMDRKELTADARELKGELYCLPCHDKMGVPICGACRRPIEGRVVNAMGKQWHVEVSCKWWRGNQYF